MKRLIPTLCSVAALLAACSQYDTDVVGEDFVPFNGVVGPYTHQVYVEFHDHSANVWGPAAHEVKVESEGARVAITCNSDSLAFFCFGATLNDSIHDGDGQLHIISDRSFALYLNSLWLTSLEGPALWCDTDQPTFMVVSGKQPSVLCDRHYQPQGSGNTVADACIMAGGELVLNGNGTLRVKSEAAPFTAGGREYRPHALHAAGGFRCANAIKASLSSLSGDALHATGQQIAIADGTWNLTAGGHAITCEEGGVSLAGGKVYAAALGSFVSAPSQQGLSITDATCMAVSNGRSPLTHDSCQYIWQQRMDTLSLMADSTYTISRKDTTRNAKYNNVGNLTPRVALSSPWVLLSTSAMTPVDTVRVAKKTGK